MPRSKLYEITLIWKTDPCNFTKNNNHTNMDPNIQLLQQETKKKHGFKNKLGGCFKYFSFSSRNLGKWSNLTSIFFRWVNLWPPHIIDLLQLLAARWNVPSNACAAARPWDAGNGPWVPGGEKNRPLIRWLWRRWDLIFWGYGWMGSEIPNNHPGMYKTRRK